MLPPTTSSDDGTAVDTSAAGAAETALTPDRAGSTVQLSIDSLLPADSPRLEGEQPDHVRALAETDASLPPILVNGDSMRVIDGMHRLRAAQLNGRQSIEARLFHGSDARAFILAVEANIAHGLPLSRSDREAAAERILTEQRGLSDRAVATITGLAPSSVAAIRRRVACDGPQPTARLGRDGRVRPLNAGTARQLAMRMIEARPGASLREIARAAGISPTTVRDVRERMQRGNDPVPLGRQAVRTGQGVDPAPSTRNPRGLLGRRGAAARRNPVEIVQSLGKDPSLRLSQSGRELLRWLGFQARATVDWEKRVEAVPAHCVPTVAQMAAACAQEWLEIARRLESKAREDESGQTPSTDQPRGARPSDRFAQLDKHDAPQLALAPRTRQA